MDLERASKFKEVFTGAKEQNIEAFFDRFDLWCAKNGHTDEYKVENFVFCIDGPAYTVYKSLAKSTSTDYPGNRLLLFIGTHKNMTPPPLRGKK